MNGVFFSFFIMISESIKESQCFSSLIEICKIPVREGFGFWP